MAEVIEGPLRKPAQMLADQSYDGHSSIHDDSEAEKLGIKAGPIEGPTHFSQFSPYLVDMFGKDWFERGCFSAHFQNMVVEGEAVRVFVEQTSDISAHCRAEKEDGTPVLEASATLGPDHGETLLEARKAKLRPAGDLVILEDMSVGMTSKEDELVIMKPDQNMGNLYPFSLNEKLEKITEPMDWYHDASASPWGKAIIPTEMVSVLGNYTGGQAGWPVKRPSIGLFADLEIRMVDGPLFVGETYRLKREIVALSQSRRVENYWVLTSFFNEAGDTLKAQMLLNHGVMKASYPDYPKELLPS
ncbi:hypothetical protein [Henriciella sp.]|uniref:hypothetical protein n=1 Tax=Henriciella sp. TaxID=1968823 RepID=UPI0026273728|nr:hypothetical protein [Henriciella sp.]